jgi:hypothetical protein
MSAFDEIDQAKLFQSIQLGIRDGLNDSFVIEEFKRGYMAGMERAAAIADEFHSSEDISDAIRKEIE